MTKQEDEKLVDYSTDEKIAEAQVRLWNIERWAGGESRAYGSIREAQRIAVEWFARNRGPKKEN